VSASPEVAARLEIAEGADVVVRRLTFWLDDIAQWFPGSKAEAEIGPSEDKFMDAYAGRAGMLPDYPAVQAAAGAIIATHCARLAGTASREDLWAAAAGLETSTLFGGFKIDPRSGTQIGRRTVLVRWTDGKPAAVRLTTCRG